MVTAERIKALRSAIDFLTNCGEMRLEKLLTANEMSGFNMPRAQLEQLWEQSRFVLPIGGKPGGAEFMRKKFQDTLAKAIEELGGEKNRPWWKFW